MEAKVLCFKTDDDALLFWSDADEEPLGCVDVEAFTSVSCREVHQDVA